MFHGFKNGEYLKYTLGKKIDSEALRLSKESSSGYTHILSSIFASVFAAVCATSLNNLSIVKNAWWNFFLIILITIFTAGIAYVIVYFVSKEIKIRYDARKVYKANDRFLIEQFDNIACDSVMISEKYEEYLKNSTTFSEIELFYVFEVLHYLRKALTCTEAVLAKSVCKLCICKDNDQTKIDYFRTKNIVNLADVQLKFIKTYCKNNKIIDTEVLQAITNLEHKQVTLSNRVIQVYNEI